MELGLWVCLRHYFPTLKSIKNIKREDKERKEKKHNREEKNIFKIYSFSKHHYYWFLSFYSRCVLISNNDWGKNKTKLKADMVTLLLLIILIGIKYIKIGSQSVHYNILSGTKIAFHLKLFADTEIWLKFYFLLCITFVLVLAFCFNLLLI